MITCDHASCPASAVFRVRWAKSDALDLFLCGHHYRQALPNLPVGTEARTLQTLGEGDWYSTSAVLAELVRGGNK